MKDTLPKDTLLTKQDFIYLTNKFSDKISSTIPTNEELKAFSDTLANKLSTSLKVADKNDKLWRLFTYDTVFTVIVTLLIFVIRICIDRLVKSYDKRSKQQELRNYFKHFLNILIDKTCSQLIQLYKEVYQTYGINEGIL